MPPSPTTPVEAPSRVIVAIATVGRGPILSRCVRHLATQTQTPDAVVISGTQVADFGDLDDDALPCPISFLTGPKGLCQQRNRVLDAARAGDIVLFLDDDFLLAPDYLARLEPLFTGDPGIVMATGDVLVDGILGPGMDYDEGKAALDRALSRAADTPDDAPISDTRNAYGCNMAVRMDTVRAHDLRFDERLPLYAWFEDVDFSLRAKRHGRVVKAEALRGVHLGTKTGRTPGRKLGYSQIANMVYLVRKGVLPRRIALRYMSRNMASNLYHSVRPQAWTDHRGRLMGNLLSLRDVALGRSDPERISRL